MEDLKLRQKTYPLMIWHTQDTFVWSKEKSGNYSVYSAYEDLHPKGLVWEGASKVWSNQLILKVNLLF